MRGCFVTGTDTGAGKTVVSAAILAALAARGVPVRAVKPVVTGLDEPPGPVWPPDHVLLASITGQPADEVSPIAFGPAVSPHLAAELAGKPLEGAAICAAVRSAIDDAERAGAEAIVIEGVGGLLVPFSDNFGVRELAREIGLPLVLAARPGLGTINHTLLTLEAARASALVLAGIVLTPWPTDPDAIARSNRDTIARLGGVPVSVLPVVERPAAAELARAAASLPLEDWLGTVESS
ncbi:MAG: dethiobiotin synthase [Solirubrobacteraceae bacterium]